MEELSKLKELILKAKHCVAFTGAGISTLAGIQDFRGKDGLYKQPENQTMFDIDVFNRDPSIYYKLAKDLIYGLEEKRPAVVHDVLAKLEEVGILKAVITQNIDLLHQKAGSKNVLEIHGSPSIHSCRSCSYQTSFEKVVEVAKKGEIPHCPKCNGVLKPEITFFGEALPALALQKAQVEAVNADLLLVLGSSLTVYPAAALPEYTLRSGGKMVIVNNQPTVFDRFATLCFKDLAEVFEYLKKNLGVF